MEWHLISEELPPPYIDIDGEESDWMSEEVIVATDSLCFSLAYYDYSEDNWTILGRWQGFDGELEDTIKYWINVPDIMEVIYTVKLEEGE